MLSILPNFFPLLPWFVQGNCLFDIFCAVNSFRLATHIANDILSQFKKKSVLKVSGKFAQILDDCCLYIYFNQNGFRQLFH